MRASSRGLDVTASSSRVQTLNPKQCYCYRALTTKSANVTLAVLGQTKGHVGQYSESSSGNTRTRKDRENKKMVLTQHCTNSLSLQMTSEQM